MMEIRVRSLSYNTLVIGTGASGYNAADTLYQLGVRKFAIISENIKSGTSRNTGSDKQTYYKLSLSGDYPDSVGKMAEVYFNGQCTDGEHALIESALSTQCFFKLVNLGVDFPHNRYGEYVGYKTDHDPATRATSIGPYTSRKMTECLERSVVSKGIEIIDHCQVVKLVSDGKRIVGVIAYDSEKNEFLMIYAKNVVLATGGPAGMYSASVYPVSQFGATGFAFEAGAKGKNLTEWQCGLASVHPRWNVSGSYMQVIPRFVSTDENGNDEREFLYDYFEDEGKLLSMIFLKGYQWPFDVRKVMEGSSIIDVLVYIETFVKRRKVYLDFMHNPGMKGFDCSKLSKEAFEYLENADICFGTPIERLRKMNDPAYQLYLGKGVDLEKEMLEINLSVQHNNGGLSVDDNWETNIKGLYAVGEVAGTHGVYRPGGSALNAGQVGAVRAANSIWAKGSFNDDNVSEDEMFIMKRSFSELIALIETSLSEGTVTNLDGWFTYARNEMSRVGAAIRDERAIDGFLTFIRPFVVDFGNNVKIKSMEEIDKLLRFRGILISQYVYLSAMLDYIKRGNGSRGSALYTDLNGFLPPYDIPDTFRFCLSDDKAGKEVQEITYSVSECTIKWRSVHSIPERDGFFENVWKEYLKLSRSEKEE